MKNFLRIITVTGLLFVCLDTTAQDRGPVYFSYQQQRINATEVQLRFKAALRPGIKLYSLQQSADDALFSTIQFDSAAKPVLNGELKAETIPQSEKDSSVSASVHYYTDSVTWLQVIKASASDSIVLKGTISFLYSSGDNYLPGEEHFKFFVQPEKKKSIFVPADTNSSITGKSLWWIFFTAFAGGLLALLTPCVYSMIPVTVSFFTKRSKTKQAGIKNSLYYAASIIIIFTILGFLATVIFGPAALNNLATNWIANLIFFALFIVFGISFLGAFEITLPSSWANKSDLKAGTGSFLGIFFMALTLVLVSFSCTGPIIGNLLVLASRGSYFGPLVGMAGFSSALALPFALFAFFPSKLNVLGKAGGWLNAVKVTLGFLEIALALKFLSNADLSKGWRLLDREVFLCCWITIFILVGIYLLGKLKFHHDDELPKNDFGFPYLSVPRLLFAIAAFTFAIYMVPGLFGAPLKGISAFVPPLGTQDFNASAAQNIIPQTSNTASKSIAQPHPVKYAAQMKIYEPEVVTRYGMEVYYEYNEALAAARLLHKPLMLDFTGINCVNCRKMEGQVWSDPKVMQRLKENFVIVSLYVDVQNIDLQQNEQYFSKGLKKNIETLGDKNADLQVSTFGANTQPYYFFMKMKKGLLLKGMAMTLLLINL